MPLNVYEQSFIFVLSFSIDGTTEMFEMLHTSYAMQQIGRQASKTCKFYKRLNVFVFYKLLKC
jgi:hypothetical protein